MISRATFIAITLGIFSVWPLPTAAQNKTAPDSTSATPPPLTANYPSDRAGVLILSSDWISIPSATPAKTHLKHGFAPAVTYGIAPA